MIDHISFGVRDFKRSFVFYRDTLKILGLECVMTFESEDKNIASAGFGSDGHPFFWIAQDSNPDNKEIVGQARGFHLAFQAPSVEAIHAWHAKCLALGGKDNGQPGPRPHYHKGYYAAFIIDPDGWRLEAVLHTYQP